MAYHHHHNQHHNQPFVNRPYIPPMRPGGRVPHNNGNRGMREQSRANKNIEIAPYECPRDPDGHPVSVPMRFEAINESGSSTSPVEDLQEFYLNSLKIAARNCGIEVDVKAGEKLTVNVTPVEGMHHSRWVVHFKVSCDNWQTKLSRFAQEFLNIVKYDEDRSIQRSEMPILYTHSPLIYPLRLINLHKDIPFKRIKFGSFFNSGQVGIHWHIEGGQTTKTDKEDGFTFHKDIDGSFEYDRKQITINFQNREAHPDGGDQYLAHYKLTINMSSIKKIGMDIVEFQNRTRRTLILHVDYAPKIQVKLKNQVPDKKNNGRNQHYNRHPHHTVNSQRSNQEPELAWGKFEHRLHICRGKFPEERSDRCALHESKLIFLELDEDDLKEKLVSKSESAIDELIFDLLSRLRHKTGKAVEFTACDQVDLIEGWCRQYDEDDEYRYRWMEVKPYGVDSDIDGYVQECIKNASEKLAYGNDYSYGNQIHAAPRLQLKIFRLRSLFEGILQRGMEIRCQLLIDRNYWYAFVALVCERYAAQEQTTLAVMENLLSIISEGKPHCTVMHLFLKEWEDSKLSHRRLTVFTKEEERQGYTRVMKFVQTPTRLIFVGNETIMSNRVLKQNSKNGTEIIRVSFRDDSGEYMREMGCGERIIRDTMRAVLLHEGIVFGGRRYVWLGNSNSQLRDHGIYMYHEEKPQQHYRGRYQPTHHKTAREIRKKLGHFDRLTSIPKWLARQGQCFTQARPSTNALTNDEVGMTYDYTGGITDKQTPYTFSDGVGTVAMTYAEKLSKEHGLPRMASAFQIRHKGQKGLVAVDPTIDERNELLKKMGQTDKGPLVYVRPSMDKFEVEDAAIGANMNETNLEIVKYSMASPLFLNRPLLNILSQVSEDQSPECHSRMMNRVEGLLDIQTSNTLQSLYSETKARDVIKEMSFPFAMEVFGDSSSLRLTCEPFFRSMLTANARYVLNKQRSKMQIRIPPVYGRSMFGIVDTTGVLQYGQCFCQYSTSTSKHTSKIRSRTDGVAGAIILTGPVMMTKNPCIEKGDVRRFEAIDVPSLRHLVDVVVFPRGGPRPHPDEMAGSDLDGDEYSLIWDPQMLFDHNEEASLFPSGEDVVKWPIVKDNHGVVNVVECEKSLAEFYIEAVTQEQIGVLSNAHLATSDFYGLENKASRSLARKISQSLDFQKNGIKPEEMSRDSIEDPDDPDRMIPPEKASRKPDYMEKMRDAGYESRGIMGDIYAEVKRYQFAIDTGEDQITMIVKDPVFDLQDWTKYEVVAKREMEAYNHGIKSIMENYGIASEGEIMSGQILSIKNRISEKESDDMNLYNTNQVIEDKVKREICAARESFFLNLINWQTDLNQVENKRRDIDKSSILCHVVRPTTNNLDNIRLKAAAVYNVCYDAANQQLQNGETTSLILSFPWVVYDVLADIKKRPDSRIRGEIRDSKEQNNEPLAAVISGFIDEYCENDANIDNYEEFKEGLEPHSFIGKSLNENEGLSRASFVLIQWAKHIGGVQEGAAFNGHHLLDLFIQFGLGDVVARGMRRAYIQPPTGEIREHLKKGEHLLKFIEYLASREFRMLTSLSFTVTNSTVLSRGEWKPFAEMVIPSYLTLVTTHHLDLPMEEEADTQAIRTAALIKEFEPRKMELPENVIRSKLDEVRALLLRATGCTQVQLRQMSYSEVFVSALGTTNSFKLLNSLIIPSAPLRAHAAHKDYFNKLAEGVYNRLVRTASEAPPPTILG